MGFPSNLIQLAEKGEDEMMSWVPSGVGRTGQFASAEGIDDDVRELSEAEEKCVGGPSDELQLEAGELLDYGRLC